MPKSKITFDDIVKAREVIDPYIEPTNMPYSRKITQLLGVKTYLKLENRQLTGSFKVRGAFNKILSLSEEQKKRGIIASSAGNHAQGVAFAASHFQIPAHIVMPSHAPVVKVTATEAMGAQIYLHGDYYDDAFNYASELSEEEGYEFVHPYNDPYIMAGQGTIGLEIFEQVSDLDTLLVPIGGGGLISGISTALKHLNPIIKIFGVVSENAQGMKSFFNKKEVGQLPVKSTIADGIAVKRPNLEIFENYIQPHVEDIISVTDDEVASSIVYLLEHEKLTVEGSGAVTLAAAQKIKNHLGKKTGLLISGGNIDLNLLAIIIERGLLKQGRLSRIQVVSSDHPGILNKLTGIISSYGSNILNVVHDRISSDLQVKETRIEFLIETRDHIHSETIKDNFKKLGVRVLDS